MSEKLTERMEVRLTKTMKEKVVRLSAKKEVSEGAIVREGLSKLKDETKKG